MGTLCAGCLASDRTLWTLHKEVYKLKLGFDLFPSFRQKTTSQRKSKQEMKLCWECHNIIASIHKFQQKVQNAQEILKKKKIDTTKVKCLSTLGAVTHIDSFDYIFYESPIVTVKQEPEMDLSDRDEYSEYEHETVLKEQVLDDLKEVLFDNNEQKIERSVKNLGSSFDDDEQKIEISVEHLNTSGYQNILNTDYNNENVKGDGGELEKEEYSAKLIEDFKQDFEEQVPSPNSDIDKMFQFTVKAKSAKLSKRKQDGKVINTDAPRKGLKKGTKVGPAKRGAHASYEIVTIADMPIENERFFLKSKYKNILIDQKEVKELRNSRVRVHMGRFQCACSVHFDTDLKLQKHIRQFHSKAAGKYICDICDKRTKTLQLMTNHLREHFLKFQCLICQKICFPRSKMFSHLRTHMKVFRCKLCEVTFGKHLDFLSHYKKLHVRMFCDSCRYNTSNKKLLVKHITKHHMPHKCNECDKVFSLEDSLRRHILWHHTISAPEESYCVECDIQFKNKVQLKDHFGKSNRHDRTANPVPCPECNKMYSKKTFMTNHYNYVHLKRTKYYCEQCSKYFLTSTHKKNHMIWTHRIGEHKKDKICPHCGRGFTLNATLTKHIRTHTGERPFACNFCPATFTQSTPCNTHMKKQHNWDKSLA